VEIDYQLTEDEYVHAQLAFWSHVRRPNRLRIQTLIASVSLLLSLAALSLPRIRDKGLAWLILFFSLFLFVDRYLLAGYRLRRVFRRSPNTSSGRHVTITEDGIKIVLPNSSEEINWSAFQKVHELEHEFLLMYSPQSFVIIPKRAFDAEGFGHFRSVVHNKGLLVAGSHSRLTIRHRS
jgi:hypothetical protein